MIREVHLHGDLREEFGHIFKMDIATCAEAVRALCQMVPGFQRKVEAGVYRVVRGALDAGADHTEEELLYGLGEKIKEIHIIPVALGGKDSEGVGKVILGTLLIAAASFLIPGSALIFGESMAAMVGKAGIAIALGGVAQMLSQSPQSNQEQERSELFAGSPNQAVPGSAIPVIFGEMEVPVKIISAAIHLEDRV